MSTNLTDQTSRQGVGIKRVIALNGSSITTFRQFAVLQVIREEEFSPLKNAPGAAKDTPEMARDALCNLHYQYIVNAGGKFKDDNDEILPDIPR